MARLNVLTGEAIATPPAPPPPVKRSSRKSKAQAPRAPKVSTLPGIIAAFPQSMFAILTNNPEDANPARAEAIRENFLKYAHSHPNATNWRTAFDAFWHIQNTDRGTGETTRISANVAPLLTRAFPKNLRRMLAARNDAIAFDAAIRGRVAFSRTYEAKGNRDGLPDITVEVLPPAQCPVNIPAVAVTTCIGLRLVFAVIELDAWLPYEHHLEPVGLHSAGLGRLIDAILHPIQMPIAPAEEEEGINGGSEGRRVEVVAVEMEPVLCRHLYENYDSCNGEKTLYQRDFLTMKPAETGLFDAIIMNPPFHMRSDIKHILHALTFLKPEGKLAAICMEGPHRDKALRPLASKWISLDPAAFKETGTHVQTAMLLIEMTKFDFINMLKIRSGYSSTRLILAQ